MSIHSYEVAADGSEFDETWVNEMAVGLGRINGVSINPINSFDYVYWRSDGGAGGTYYAKNNRTGVVTSNASHATLINGLLANRTTHYHVGHTFDLTSAINLAAYTHVGIYGSPKRGTNFTPADTINAFEFDENWWCVLKDFYIDGSNQTTSGMGLKFTEATGVNYAFRNQVKNIEFAGCYIGIGDLFAGTNGGSSNLFRDLTFIDNTYSDIKFHVNGTGGWSFQDIGIDHLATQCTDDYAFRMVGADGVIMDRVSLLMGGAGSKGGALFEDTDFIWMSDCDIEKAGLTGWNFINCTYGKINNLRMHESGMRVAAAGEASIRLIGVRDFVFSNSSLNICAGATNTILNFQQDGATQCDHITFIGGHVTNSSSYGAVISNTSGNLKFIGMNFYGNADDDIYEEDSPNFCTYKSNNMNSGNNWTFIGARNTYDQFILSETLDLSAAGRNVETFFAPTDCVLATYRIIYTEAASGDAGVAIHIGKYRTGVALDDDFFDTTDSVPNRGLGDEDFFATSNLTNQIIAAGDILTVGTDGGKTGAGEVKLNLSIIENAS